MINFPYNQFGLFWNIGKKLPRYILDVDKLSSIFRKHCGL